MADEVYTAAVNALAGWTSDFCLDYSSGGVLYRWSPMLEDQQRTRARFLMLRQVRSPVNALYGAQRYVRENPTVVPIVHEGETLVIDMGDARWGTW